MLTEIKQLENETPAKSEVRTERGIPRLFVNNEEIYPLLAWSWGLVHSASIFKKAGINILHPVLGLNSAWPESGQFDFSGFESLFSKLLCKNPGAFFLPRVLLDVPDWWLKKYPEELIKPAVKPVKDSNLLFRVSKQNPEGGWLWGIRMEEPSFASEIWKADLEKLLRAFLQFIENSPLRSRIIGYQLGSGIYGEWAYFLSEFVPDFSEPLQDKFKFVPDLENRLRTVSGLFRDPRQEKEVINYYEKFHEFCADILLGFAKITKEATENRVIVGAFYTYLLENVWIHEGGHLSPEKILNSNSIDFLASPYTYQPTNIKEQPGWQHDIEDEAGNWLGRCRGVGGDGGYRVLLESLKRHNKLFFVEMDPSTYLEPLPGKNAREIDELLARIGGVGFNSVDGSRKILQRDLGQMFVCGNGGWLFDFGPALRKNHSWYDDQPIVDEVLNFSKLGKIRPKLNMSSCAEIAAIYDAKSFYATKHWLAQKPFPKGAANLDYFSHWFLDSQARVFHRIGAPMDFLYRFDLTENDVKKYKILFMVNLFYLTHEDVRFLRNLLKDSGVTVVWFYAPGFVSPEKIDLAQMEHLTGFQFEILDKPGPMLINSKLPDGENQVEQKFGVKQTQSPRFVVSDAKADVLGLWADKNEAAFAAKKVDGWNSVYLGSAPLPVEILRRLVDFSGAKLWSSKPDIVRASEDAAMLVATSEGERKFSLPKPMKTVNSNQTGIEFQLDMEMGEVEIFIKA